MKNLGGLKGKRILFLCVQWFDLEKDIVTQLEKHGAEVTYFDERPANNNFTKGLLRINRDLLEKRVKKYYANILDQINDKQFDFLFVNRGEVVPESFLEQFIQLYPNCKRIFYTWDSFANLGHSVNILKYFHKKFTFDKKDASEYEIGFRPLYFMDRYSKINNTTKNENIDLLFLGTAHSDRYIISNQIADWCKQNDLVPYNYYFMQGKFVYFYKKFFDKSFNAFDYKKLSFKSLTSEEVIELYERSNVILDISHPNQSGLTMRTFETIGAKKKLITTNSNIKDYPFYNPNNICVIDRKQPKLTKDFFTNQYQFQTEEMYYRCSIDGWIEDIFLGDEVNFWKS